MNEHNLPSFDSYRAHIRLKFDRNWGWNNSIFGNNRWKKSEDDFYSSRIASQIRESVFEEKFELSILKLMTDRFIYVKWNPYTCCPASSISRQFHIVFSAFVSFRWVCLFILFFGVFGLFFLKFWLSLKTDNAIHQQKDLGELIFFFRFLFLFTCAHLQFTNIHRMGMIYASIEILLYEYMEWEQCEWRRRHRKTQNHSLNSALAYLFRSLVYLFIFRFFFLSLCRSWSWFGRDETPKKIERDEKNRYRLRICLSEVYWRYCAETIHSFSTHNT